MEDLIILGQATLQVLNNFKIVFLLLPIAIILLMKLEKEAENDKERI